MNRWLLLTLEFTRGAGGWVEGYANRGSSGFPAAVSGRQSSGTPTPVPEP